MTTEKRILRFNIKNDTFQELNSHLNVGREDHRCAFIPHTNKIMITGGFHRNLALNGTEIIDTEDGNVTMASPMNFERYKHGMGVITFDGEDRLAVFGGFNGTNKLDSVELYDTQTMEWEIADFKLSKEKQSFGFLTEKLSDILSQLEPITKPITQYRCVETPV